MKRAEEIQEAKNAYMEHIGSPDLTFQYNALDIVDAYLNGAEWADEHPNWISVEDELPPIGGIVLVAIPLGGELSVLPLSIKNESDLEYLVGMTHWMKLPPAPKKGDNQ